MMKLVRTTKDDPDFLKLVRLLDAGLKEVNGEDQSFYNTFNQLNNINHVIVAYEYERPVACGAMKPYDDHTMEIKRMYTVSDYRGKGAGSLVVTELEKWAKELSFSRCILETSKDLHPAVALYTRQGYSIIPNYDQYIGNDKSVCFEKILYPALNQ